MAETVKKSRIVSEDDLEESLMQEFNMRLKSCMSQEDEHEPEEKEEHLYDNVKIIKGQIATADAELIYDDVLPISSKEFIEIEKQFCSSDEGGALRVLIDVNGFQQHKEEPMVQTTDLDVNVELLPPEKTDFEHDDHVYETIEEDELIYENVQNLQKPNLTLPTTCLTDMSDSVDADAAQEGISVKDRMFLSTDDTSCLLFTQTVTSPMLTPSEENIDFLKGFRRQSTLSDNTNSNSSPKFDETDQATDEISAKDFDKNEVEYENLELNQTYDDVSEVDNVVVCNIVVDDSHCTPKEQEIAAGGDSPENAEDNPILMRENVRELTSFDIKHQTQLFIDNEIYELEKVTQVHEEHEEEHESENIYENVVAGDQKEDDLEGQCNGSVSSEVELIEEAPKPVAEVEVELPVKDEQPQMNGKPEKVETNGVKYADAEASLDSEDEDVKVDNPSQLVNALKTKYLHNATAEIVKTPSAEKYEIAQLKTLDIMKQISKFENNSPTKEDPNDYSTDSTETTETMYTESTTVETKATMQDKSLKKKKTKKSRSHEKENISVNNTNNETNSQEENFYNVNVKSLCRSFGDLTKIGDEKFHNEKNIRDKSSFNKFDALQKKNVLHVRSSDSSKAQEKFNGSAPIDSTNCKACGKVVFQMEQMKAEKSIWHKNCFRCQECGKQLTVDTYESNEGSLYCKPHFKALFAPKVIEDDVPPSDKPDLGLEELHSLNVRERFQVFEHYEDVAGSNSNNVEKATGVNVKRSPSILSKLARFQAKGMDVGVTDDSLNGIPIEESASEPEEEEEEEIEGEDADLVRARKAQKEKPFHFVQMSDVKNKWEHGEQQTKDDRREERKQEIQSIRNRLFMGKQGKMKEAYQQAVLESESNVKKSEAAPVEVCDTRTLKERFEKGEVYSLTEEKDKKEAEDMSVFESGISKKSRSIFLELDANASKAPQISPVSPPKSSDVRKTKDVFLARQTSDDVVKSSEQVDDVKIETSDIQQRFKFFEAYKEPEKKRKAFRITPPREGQVKSETPEREIYRDPDIIRSEEQIEDSIVAKESHTATKVLNKFRQMEENLNKEPLPLGPKPLKRFTPPPEPARPETTSEEEGSETDEESESCDAVDQSKVQDADLLEAQKAARARQLRAKFERWEANEIKREQVNIAEEIGEDQSQIESTRALRARFESLKETSNDIKSAPPRVKVNRFVDTTSNAEVCDCCKEKVYPLEKISVHGHVYHKGCFKCKECNTVLRMDSYTYNQGLLYCAPHFKRLFISKGNYDSAFGLDQHKEKWNATVA